MTGLRERASRVEETPDGVLLKAAPLFKPTRHEDVAGMLAYDGPAISL